MLGGLKGVEEDYVDRDGNVTSRLIGQYVYDKITSLPQSERPKQIPIIKTEISGDIVLATYPEKIKHEQKELSSKHLLELLQQGRIANFNKIRERSDYVVPNLSKANLREANLEGVNLERGLLREAKLGRAKLGGAKLEGADIAGANLREANLRLADLKEADLQDAKLERATLIDAVLTGAHLAGAIPAGANLEQTYLLQANLSGTNLHYTRNLPISKKGAKSRGADV